MVMANCIGTIDEDYRGEVSFVFYHVMSKMPKYKVGDKIAQIKIGATLPIEFEEAFELSDTERGEGREGSTGK
jgi:dUTP pyrophosphatase